MGKEILTLIDDKRQQIKSDPRKKMSSNFSCGIDLPGFSLIIKDRVPQRTLLMASIRAQTQSMTFRKCHRK
jgi:hypothetical protein